MEKLRVLFVCVHNSGRSQMAEAYLNYLSSDKYFAESAGLEPGILNPYVIKVMKEDGIDISRNRVKSAFDFYKSGKMFEYIITVCDKSAAERCPVFPGIKQRIAWSFPDPSKLKGTDEEILEGTRAIRDEIKSKLREWLLERDPKAH